MLRNTGLKDPMERTREMKESEFTKYVEICKQAKAEGQVTEPATVQEIHDTFVKTHESDKMTPETLEETWAKVGPKVAENPGLAQFILDYDGAKSEYFFPWLVSVYTSPSEALEMAYGAGRGLSCGWVYRTDESDPIESFVRNDPTFVYNRERQLFVADLVTTIKKKATRKSPATVIDLGAGRMAWARYHGFGFDPKLLKIYAYDKDPTIEEKRLFPVSLEELGLEYHHADMKEAMVSPTTKNADLIMLGGVASYYPMAAFTENVIRPVYQLLKTGGVFFFDLQVKCPYLLRSMSIFNWPTMVNFASSAAEAIAMVEQVRKELWASGAKFGAEYTLDTYNQTPSSVMITLTKI